MALIFGISSIPHPPDLPSAIGDKGGHAILYFGLGAVMVRALAGGWTQPVTLKVAAAAVVYSTVYGVTDELHQALVPPRVVEAADLAADAIGAALAAAGLFAWSRRRRRAR
jgi:VanZ family protein